MQRVLKICLSLLPSSFVTMILKTNKNLTHFKCMEPKPWFKVSSQLNPRNKSLEKVCIFLGGGRRGQLGSNFIWNQPKIQNLQKNLVDWLQERHMAHMGVMLGVSHVCCLSPTLSCKCHQHKFKNPKKKNKG